MGLCAQVLEHSISSCEATPEREAAHGDKAWAITEEGSALVESG